MFDIKGHCYNYGSKMNAENLSLNKGFFGINLLIFTLSNSMWKKYHQSINQQYL